MRRRNLWRRVLATPILLLVLLLVSCASTPPRTAQEPPPPQPLEPVKGKWTLVSFGADWCPECQRMKPQMKRMQKEQPGITYRYIDTEKPQDQDKEYLDTYFKSPGLPYTVLLDENSKIGTTYVGYVSYSSIVADIGQINELRKKSHARNRGGTPVGVNHPKPATTP